MAAVRSLTSNLTFYDNRITAFYNGVLANNGDITPRYPMWIYINNQHILLIRERAISHHQQNDLLSASNNNSHMRMHRVY